MPCRGKFSKASPSSLSSSSSSSSLGPVFIQDLASPGFAHSATTRVARKVQVGKNADGPGEREKDGQETREKKIFCQRLCSFPLLHPPPLSLQSASRSPLSGAERTDAPLDAILSVHLVTIPEDANYRHDSSSWLLVFLPPKLGTDDVGMVAEGEISLLPRPHDEWLVVRSPHVRE